MPYYVPISPEDRARDQRLRLKAASFCALDEDGYLIRGQVSESCCEYCGVQRFDDGTCCKSCGEYSKAARVKVGNKEACESCGGLASKFIFGHRSCGDLLCKSAIRVMHESANMKHGGRTQ